MKYFSLITAKLPPRPQHGVSSRSALTSSAQHISVSPTSPQSSARIPHLPRSPLFSSYSSPSSWTSLDKDNFRLDVWTSGMTRIPSEKTRGSLPEWQGLPSSWHPLPRDAVPLSQSPATPISAQMLGVQPEPITWKTQEVQHPINAMSTHLSLTVTVDTPCNYDTYKTPLALRESTPPSNTLKLNSKK